MSTRAMTPDPREEKLPVWAQNLLTDLRNEVTFSHTEIERISQREDPTLSRVVIDRFDRPLVGLGDERITFLPRRGADPLEGIEVHTTTGGIHVTAYQGVAAVVPSASNSVDIFSIDYGFLTENAVLSARQIREARAKQKEANK